MNALISLFTWVQALAARIGRSLEWLPPTLARLAVGFVFAQSGWGKLHSLDDVTAFFQQLGLPAPMFQATLVATTELVCGCLLLLGLVTRLAAVPLIITMLVAIKTALWPDLESASGVFGLSETLYVVLLVWLGTAGPGPFSIDALLERALPRLRAGENLRPAVAGAPPR